MFARFKKFKGLKRLDFNFLLFGQTVRHPPCNSSNMWGPSIGPLDIVVDNVVRCRPLYSNFCTIFYWLTDHILTWPLWGKFPIRLAPPSSLTAFFLGIFSALLKNSGARGRKPIMFSHIPVCRYEFLFMLFKLKYAISLFLSLLYPTQKLFAKLNFDFN